MEDQVDVSMNVLQPVLPTATLLVAAVLADALLGDPVYWWHPVRLLGRSLQILERALRRLGLDGYLGGCLLFLILSVTWVGGVSLLLWWLATLSRAAAAAFHLFLLYNMIALRDLLRHGMRVDRDARWGDLDAARRNLSMLVGRDTDRMDAAACRRAAVESFSESVVDGVICPLFWYTLLGLPGALLFKVASTMDSMVGYKTPRYLRFGWCGARADDVMNFIPARLTWLLMGGAALLIPGCSAPKAWRIGRQQHAVVPGPNSGWSEATAAGALERRLAGPIWEQGRLVTEVWLGEPNDPPGGQPGDLQRAGKFIVVTTLLFVGCAVGVLLCRQWLAAGSG